MGIVIKSLGAIGGSKGFIWGPNDEIILLNIGFEPVTFTFDHRLPWGIEQAGSFLHQKKGGKQGTNSEHVGNLSAQKCKLFANMLL